MKPVLSSILPALGACLLLAGQARANCTSLIVTRGASAGGSVMITYTCDGRFHPTLRAYPAADHEPGTFIEIRRWRGKVLGRVKQVPHTYAVVGLMNEHQLTIGETTFDGRKELQNPKGLLHYWYLMRFALQRARTAREAIQVMTGLVEEYGYSSTGESFSIADPREAWIMEMIGPGPGGKGALWVARRIPDGCVCCHANRARIGTFPLDDPENCLYDRRVIPFAIEKGYYHPDSGKPFRFCDAYCPADPEQVRSASTRVWSLLRRCAPSLNLKSDFHRGVKGAEPYPLWVKPDRALTLKDVFALMRDHYEGTAYDMTRGIAAGPFGTPTRCRPLSWKVGGKEGFWERPISTIRTGFSFVAECRSWLPDPVGGVFWYGVDNTDVTCYVPLYTCIRELPPSFTRGSLRKFSWDSAWWVFNFVGQLANVKYSYMIRDIRKVQQELEGHLMRLQPAVERTAERLFKADPDLMARFLTDHAVGNAERVVKRWRELGEFLLTKYNDGFVQDEKGRPQAVGYPEAWLRRVHKERGR